MQWLKGKHALTMGLTFQFQEINNANPATFTGVLIFGYNPYSTAQFASSSSSLSDGTAGIAYAGFSMLGAAGDHHKRCHQPDPRPGLRLRAGGTLRPVSPMIGQLQDHGKFTSTSVFAGTICLPIAKSKTTGPSSTQTSPMQPQERPGAGVCWKLRWTGRELQL